MDELLIISIEEIKKRLTINSEKISKNMVREIMDAIYQIEQDGLISRPEHIQKLNELVKKLNFDKKRKTEEKNTKKKKTSQNYDEADLDYAIKHTKFEPEHFKDERDETYISEQLKRMKRMANQGGDIGRKNKEELARMFPSKKKPKNKR